MRQNLTAAFLSVSSLVLINTAFGQTRLLQPLTHHVRQVTRTGEAPLVRRMASNQSMQLDLVLPLSNPGGLDAFLKSLYDPSSPSFHHFLTPAEFTAQFGPTQAQYDALVNFAKDNGFTVVGGTRDGMDVQVTAPVSVIENAFHITMGVHEHPTENRMFYAPDREPTVALPFQLWHISGLNNYSIPQPKLKNRSNYAQAHGMSSADVVTHATTGSGPSNSFLGSDMRAAYYGNSGMTDAAGQKLLTGAGQILGLLEFQGTNLSDVTRYYSTIQSTIQQTPPATPIQLLSVDGTRTACNGNCDDTEPTLDITQALGMAPGLSKLIVYVGSSDTAILSAMTTDPLPRTIGCSWGWSPADPSALDVYFKKMQAQGQTFFVASGDNSTWTTKNYEWPADDPYVVTVGGTDLMTSGPGGGWMDETAWVDSGGGVSTNNIAIPSWQQISGVINGYNSGSTSLRNGPDVAANADFSFFVCARGTCTANQYGGTSFAAPMWAAYIALANEGAAANGKGTAVGFINPRIYAQNAGDGTAYAKNFHDIATGTSGSYAAVPGYDLVTGWGSPTPALIDALLDATYSVSASPSSLTIAPGANATTTVTVNGCCSTSSLSASGAPAGFTASFSPTSITGSGTSTMTISVASGVTPGNYNIPVTTEAGTTGVSVTVSSSSSLSLSASLSSTSVNRGSSTQGSVVASGNFSSPVALSASSGPNAPKVSFSPTSINASNGSSAMTVTVASSTKSGIYTITITGKSGSTTATTSFRLTVN